MAPVAEDLTAGDGPAVSTFDTDVPQKARIGNHLLGGTEDVAADRAAGDQSCAVGRKV